jgi:hypothetical protein
VTCDWAFLGWDASSPARHAVPSASRLPVEFSERMIIGSQIYMFISTLLRSTDRYHVVLGISLEIPLEIPLQRQERKHGNTGKVIAHELHWAATVPVPLVEFSQGAA